MRGAGEHERRGGACAVRLQVSVLPGLSLGIAAGSDRQCSADAFLLAGALRRRCRDETRRLLRTSWQSTRGLAVTPPADIVRDGRQ
jgi:hypothetical protein